MTLSSHLALKGTIFGLALRNLVEIKKSKQFSGDVSKTEKKFGMIETDIEFS